MANRCISFSSYICNLLFFPCLFPGRKSVCSTRTFLSRCLPIVCAFLLNVCPLRSHLEIFLKTLECWSRQKECSFDNLAESLTPLGKWEGRNYADGSWPSYFNPQIECVVGIFREERQSICRLRSQCKLCCPSKHSQKRIGTIKSLCSISLQFLPFVIRCTAWNTEISGFRKYDFFWENKFPNCCQGQ